MKVLISEDTYNKLLTERATSNSRVILAIKRNAIVKFYYKGDEKEKEGWRTGEIYAFGESTRGNRVIRVYQTSGTTSTRIPDWKLFLVDKIRSFQHVGIFETPRPKFNSNGDNSMQKVYNIAEF